MRWRSNNSLQWRVAPMHLLVLRVFRFGFGTQILQ
jgi:hypothetical protein